MNKKGKGKDHLGFSGSSLKKKDRNLGGMPAQQTQDLAEEDPNVIPKEKIVYAMNKHLDGWHIAKIIDSRILTE